jgi:hypothetical protein
MSLISKRLIFFFFRFLCGSEIIVRLNSYVYLLDAFSNTRNETLCIGGDGTNAHLVAPSSAVLQSWLEGVRALICSSGVVFFFFSYNYLPYQANAWMKPTRLVLLLNGFIDVLFNLFQLLTLG